MPKAILPNSEHFNRPENIRHIAFKLGEKPWLFVLFCETSGGSKYDSENGDSLGMVPWKTSTPLIYTLYSFYLLGI